MKNLKRERERIMLTVYKPNENMCKELHKKLNMNLGPTKLVKPTLFLLADTDDLQAQVNRMESEIYHLKRMEAKRRWMRGRKR